MDFGISTLCFGTTPVTLDLLERLRRAGFNEIELHASLPAFDYHSRSYLRSIAGWFGENELPAPSLHLPYAENVIALRPIERQRAMDEIKRCLELSDFSALKYAVLHLGAPGDKFSPVFFEYAYSAIASIRAFAGVRVLIETLANAIATFDRILEFRTAAQLPDLGICYDTGHGEIDGAADAIHLDDNKGEEDLHLWPFEGNRNWPALVERLSACSFDGPLVLEGSDDRLNSASDARSRLQDLIGEAKNSIEEFRLKYKLPVPGREEEE